MENSAKDDSLGKGLADKKKKNGRIFIDFQYQPPRDSIETTWAMMSILLSQKELEYLHVHTLT